MTDINVVFNYNRENLENINELVSLNNQVNELRFQDKLGKQNFHGNTIRSFEPLTDTIKNTSQDITKTLTENSIKNHQAIEKLINKLLEIVNDRGATSSCLLSPVSKITTPENTNQFILVKDYNSYRVNGLLIHNTKPVTLYDSLLTFRDTGEKFDLKGDLLKLITNKNCNVDLASLSLENFLYDFAKGLYFDAKATGNESTRDRSLI